MSIVVIGPEERKLIEQAIESARANPISADMIRALRHEISGNVLSLRERRQPLKRPESQHVMFPGGFRASISFEQQPAGLTRHLSISTPREGRIPNVPAIRMIAEAFGLTLPVETAWLEEFEPGRHAVNLLQIVATDEDNDQQAGS